MSGAPDSTDGGRPPIDGYVDPNWPPPNGPNDTPIIIYGYTPSFALALLAVILFFILLVIHLWQNFRYRSWYFMTFPVGLLFEIVGYIARSFSAKSNPYNLIYFILAYFFIVTAPVFLAAGIYSILSALIHRLGRSYSLLPPKLLLWIFITSDVVATATQITGASLIGVRQSNREDPTTANNILMGGLAYQVFAMGVFVILSAVFGVRAREKLAASRDLAVFFAAFASATVLVYLRTCFRLAETAEGLGGNLGTSEIYFGVLEFAPVALAVLLLAVCHPGRCVGSKLAGVGTKAGERGSDSSKLEMGSPKQ